MICFDLNETVRTTLEKNPSLKFDALVNLQSMKEGIDSYLYASALTHSNYILFDLVLMQASHIRDKYKQILQEPESENSEDQWEIAYSQMAKQRKKRILTEKSPNKMQDNQNGTTQQNLLALKQKLAQSLSNCKTHCKQMERMKKEQMLFEEQKIEWGEHTSELNKIIEEERGTIKRHLDRINELENQICGLNAKIQEINVDRQLQQKQTQYYKCQLTQTRNNLQKRQKQFKSYQKDFKYLQRMKRQNEYMKDDIERLAALIDQSMKAGKLSGQLLKRHFIGKPHREIDYWCSQHLVGEVEHFLKKNQIGYGNKEFTCNLIKFVQKITEKVSKENQSKIKPLSQSQIKGRQASSLRKASKIGSITSQKKHSYHLSSMREEVTHNMKSNSCNFWKSTQSRVNPFDNQNTTPSLMNMKSICWDIITQFKSVVFELLLQKQIKRKKVKKIIDSMSSSILDLFQNSTKDEGYSRDHKNQFTAIRLSTQENTTPLLNLLH